MKLSIIIPTCRRLETLRQVLHLLKAEIEQLDVRAEIRVVDDGSGDGTGEFLDQFSRTADGLVWFAVHGVNRGPAAARNTALRGASGEWLLLMGDDIIPPPGFLKGHLDWHAGHPDEFHAVLGRVTWPEEMAPTPFMRWMEHGGRKYFFDYRAMSPGQTVSSDRFYTANVSLKRSLLRKAGLFDESFPFASQEDLEMGVRLGQAGMQLVYEPALLAHHWHVLTVDGIVRRTYLHGYSAVMYWQKTADTAPRWKKNLRSILGSVCGSSPVFSCWRLLQRLCRGSAGGPVFWWPTLVLSYWIGFSDARRGLPARDLRQTA